jgi:hypothetical protein
MAITQIFRAVNYAAFICFRVLLIALLFSAMTLLTLAWVRLVLTATTLLLLP